MVPFLNRNKFNHIIYKYNSDKYVKYFTYWKHLID
ncbi:DUF4372 domain-containing protein [Bacteroides nordii]